MNTLPQIDDIQTVGNWTPITQSVADEIDRHLACADRAGVEVKKLLNEVTLRFVHLRHLAETSDSHASHVIADQDSYTRAIETAEDTIRTALSELMDDTFDHLRSEANETREG